VPRWHRSDSDTDAADAAKAQKKKLAVCEQSIHKGAIEASLDLKPIRD
jgi:hypothetical protein